MCIFCVDRALVSQGEAPNTGELPYINAGDGKLVWDSFLGKSEKNPLIELHFEPDMLVICDRQTQYSVLKIDLGLFLACRYIYLGLFDSELEAARFSQSYIRIYLKPNCLNFLDSITVIFSFTLVCVLLNCCAMIPERMIRLL